MATFYRKLVTQLLADGTLDPSSNVLVVCGGDLDRVVFRDAGFRNVTITDIEERRAPDAFAPFRWEAQDAEALTYPDATFDVVVVHAGLHHCRSPHRALLEMYRVAKRGVLVMEARDSWAMRQACRLGVALDYEITAVTDNGWVAGGVENSAVPNYVYRWTEREVLKTLASRHPETRPRCRFFYGLELSFEATALLGKSKLMLLRTLALPLRALTWAAPSQGNCFGFWIDKPRLPDDLQPWLTLDDGTIRMKDAPGTPDQAPAARRSSPSSDAGTTSPDAVRLRR